MGWLVNVLDAAGFGIWIKEKASLHLSKKSHSTSAVENSQSTLAKNSLHWMFAMSSGHEWQRDHSSYIRWECTKCKSTVRYDTKPDTQEKVFSMWFGFTSMHCHEIVNALAVMEVHNS